MNRLFLAATLALLALPVHAGESSERWFRTGMGCYEHPCGLLAFAKYGHVETPEMRDAYELTKHNPQFCSKVFA